MDVSILAGFAAIALALACIGLYGTVSYVVGLRRQIVADFAAQGLPVVLAACACGIGLSLVSGRFLSGMLFGVSPSDPATLAGVVGIVLAVATLAVVVPAARAARVQPMQVLRDGVGRRLVAATASAAASAHARPLRSRE